MDRPEDFETEKPQQPDIVELAREVVKHLQSGSASVGSGVKRVTIDLQALAKALIDLATNAWRIRVRLTDSATRELRENVGTEDIKKVRRYIEAIFAALNEIGIEVKDRTGETFDYGLVEKVVTAQPQPGLTKELIIETIRPTIYWNSQVAQQGEVVIGTPPRPSQTEDV